ncbi:hypothetical protein D9619_007660 [Psilocybe cf. subviscida]|uniref:Uncharacterized protein n=1 Tax=Psilocybe cf. subviscida TaxID=2480587 RepID=A0A8H5ATC7_9AGAR|nr:hypothetical protein D9619_007660 [Psilocybe cf. subviscida]
MSIGQDGHQHWRQRALGVLYLSMASLNPQNFLTMKQEAVEIHPFPAGTCGVFYFHHVEGDDINSQLRFRLCHTTDEFANGSDLLLPDGHTWSRSLRYMARARRSFAPLLTLLTAEFSISRVQVDPNLTSHRVVTTLSPQDLVSEGQLVFDISGTTRANYTPDSTRRKDRTDYVRLIYHYVGLDHLPFPPGSDLCLPSGDPWFYSSHDLRYSIILPPLANVLYQDGLFKRPDTSLGHLFSTCRAIGPQWRCRLTLLLNLYLSGSTFGTQNRPSKVAIEDAYWCNSKNTLTENNRQEQRTLAPSYSSAF